MKAHLKTAVFASGFTLVLTMTASAIAGNGVGGIFNLGQTNTVNVTSTLSGTKDGALLSVSNPNAGTAATGVNVATATAKPPLTVNSSAPSPPGAAEDPVRQVGRYPDGHQDAVPPASDAR